MFLEMEGNNRSGMQANNHAVLSGAALHCCDLHHMSFASRGVKDFFVPLSL
jgi:hypothetical protein